MTNKWSIYRLFYDFVNCINYNKICKLIVIIYLFFFNNLLYSECQHYNILHLKTDTEELKLNRYTYYNI